jgi:hypothetical protein
MGTYGRIFLGKDEKTYGKEGTGWVDYDPDFECGGPLGTPGRQCAYETTKEHTGQLEITGRDGRNLHINIASHRDPLCPKTLYNMYTKAASPEKIFVRILQQRDPEIDIDCLTGYCELMAADKIPPDPSIDPLVNCPFKDHIFIYEIHAKEAAGPTWARGLISKEIEKSYKGGGLTDVKPQDHCMSIDSHMDFEPHFDDKMVQMWEDAKNEYAVLSTYVQDVEHLGEDGNGKSHHQVPHLCMVTFTTQVRTHATKCATDLVKPKLTNAVWGAGLSFAKCHAELKVQVDPHTPHIFDGEEFNRSARFWTYGYDIYTPNHVYVLHDYHKSQSNPVMHSWSTNKNVGGTIADSNRRLRTMLGMKRGEPDANVALRMQQSKYGLGDRRSLSQLTQFSGIDLVNEKPSIDGKNRCGNIQWVPFKEHPKGVNYIPRFEEDTEDPLDAFEETSVWFQVGRPVMTEKIDKKEESNETPDTNISEEHAALQEELEVNNILAAENLHEKHEELKIAQKTAKNTDASKEATGDGVVDFEPGNFLRQRGSVLRGVNLSQIKRQAHTGAITVSEFFAKYPVGDGKSSHGFNDLPFFVQVNVFLLVIGVGFAITKSKRKRGASRSSKKQ